MPVKAEIESGKNGERMIEELWQEHKHAGFPSGYGGEEIEGIDLALLDADIAGCVETYIKRRRLDLERTAALGLCYRDCTVAVRGLNGVVREYFLRLEKLAMLVLQLVIETEKA
jgi:hypothetical protein